MCRIPAWEPTGKKNRRSGVRASVVALKPSNSGGAKGRRKVDDDGDQHQPTTQIECPFSD